MGAPRIKRTRHREVATHPLRVTPWSHPTGLYSSTEKVFDGRPLALGLGHGAPGNRDQSVGGTLSCIPPETCSLKPHPQRARSRGRHSLLESADPAWRAICWRAESAESAGQSVLILSMKKGCASMLFAHHSMIDLPSLQFPPCTCMTGPLKRHRLLTKLRLRGGGPDLYEMTKP